MPSDTHKKKSQPPAPKEASRTPPTGGSGIARPESVLNPPARTVPVKFADTAEEKPQKWDAFAEKVKGMRAARPKPKAAAKPTESRSRYEHDLLTLSHNDLGPHLVNRLNERGKDGWRVLDTWDNSQGRHFLLEREIRS